jgi:hypothetical protein
MVSIKMKNSPCVKYDMNMIIHQPTYKNDLISTIGPLIVRHIIADIARHHLKRSFCLPAKTVFLRRDTVTLPAPPKRLGVGMARLRRQGDSRIDSEDFKSAEPPKVPTRAYADWYRRVSKKEQKP